MKKKLVKLQFNLIIDVGDDDTQEDIMQIIHQEMLEAIHEDMEANNLISIEDYKDEEVS